MIHDGRLSEGAKRIREAIEVNPEAHFGREKIQLALVEFLIAQSETDESGRYQLPLDRARLGEERNDHDIHGTPVFCEFLGQRFGDGEQQYLTKELRKEAMEGVMGMMRFSQHDHPVLLDVLGQLCEQDMAHRMSARAYLLAAEQVESPAKDQYQELARMVLTKQHDPKTSEAVALEPLAKSLQQERAEAESWFAALAADEADWIRKGVDVEASFQAKYRDEPELNRHVVSGMVAINQSANLVILWLVIGIIFAIIVVGLLVRRHYRKSTVSVS